MDIIARNGKVHRFQRPKINTFDVHTDSHFYAKPFNGVGLFADPPPRVVTLRLNVWPERNYSTGFNL
jgi:hypothetical protein